LVVDFIAPIFGMNAQWDFMLSKYIIMPTSDIQFNIALSIFSTLILIYVQFGTLGYKKFFYNYIPFWGQWYIQIQRWQLSAVVYYPLIIAAKLWDIILSLFLWFLDFVGLLAKVISLAFRLFWNMVSGTILLWILLVGLNNFTQGFTWFLWGINFPIIAPILVYAQGMLVALIQAMVFPLLVAIFVRMAMVETI
jgi:F0F1-type ATP synthase membrane subunit a